MATLSLFHRLVCSSSLLIVFALTSNFARGQEQWIDWEQNVSASPCSNFCDSQGCQFNTGIGSRGLTGSWSAFAGLDGSKQPQDYGVNANLGGRFALDYSAALIEDRGIGFQIGSAVTASANAVQVFELLGESTDRLQSFTTVAIFQRSTNGFGWGAAYDLLYQESFDDFLLGQCRLNASFDISPMLQLGTTFNVATQSDEGLFNQTNITLDPINMFNVYLQREWETGVRTKIWAGFAEGHNENNAVTGSLPRQENPFLFGSEIFAPLNNWLAIYGEANVMLPADTGVVDAYLGVQFIPGGLWQRSRANPFRSMFSVAGSPTFATDLSER